jgi:hypothetical protein
VVGKLVVVSTPIRRNAYYPEILAQQAQVTAAAAENMKQTPMYQLYASLAPRPEDFPRLLDKIGEAMKQEFDFSKEVAGIQATTLIVAGDADIFPPAHAVEVFGLLGGGKRDPGWDGSGRPKSQLAILPGLTHYNIGSAPALGATVIPFLAEPRRRAGDGGKEKSPETIGVPATTRSGQQVGNWRPPASPKASQGPRAASPRRDADPPGSRARLPGSPVGLLGPPVDFQGFTAVRRAQFFPFRVSIPAFRVPANLFRVGPPGNRIGANSFRDDPAAFRTGVTHFRIGVAGFRMALAGNSV